MSGYLDSILSANTLSRQQVLAGHDGFFLAGLMVGFLLTEDQVVVRDPIEPPNHPCDIAHVAVIGGKGNTRRRRLAKAALWVEGMCPVGAEARLPA